MKLSWPAAYAFHLFCLFAFLTLVMLPLFVGMVFGTPPLRSDHRAHIEMLQDGLAGKGWPGHLLYHVVVYTVAGFKSTFPALGKASVTVLMSCVLAKAWIAFEWLRRSCVVTDAKTTNTLSAFYGVTALTFIMVVTAALMFAAPLMRPHHGDVIYLGQFDAEFSSQPHFAVGLAYRTLSILRWISVSVRRQVAHVGCRRRFVGSERPRQAELLLGLCSRLWFGGTVPLSHILANRTVGGCPRTDRPDTFLAVVDKFWRRYAHRQ